MINVPLGDERLSPRASRLVEPGRLRDCAVRKSSAAARTRSRGYSSRWHPSDELSVTFGAMHTDSESDGSPTDMTFFNMAPVCPLDPTNPFYCLQGNYADWVSDFLEASGQAAAAARRPASHRRRLRDAGLVLPRRRQPGLGRRSAGSGTSRTTRSSTRTSTWQISDRLSFLSTTGFSDFSSSGVSDWQLTRHGVQARGRRIRGALSGVPVQLEFRWTARST